MTGHSAVLRAARILVVDDDPAVRRLLTYLCERRLGAKVTGAESGETALAALETGSIDLLLVDVMMPGLDGRGLVTRLREDERFRELPVVMISAVGDRATVEGLIELGVRDYLLKPVDPAMAERRLGRALRALGFRDA